jgi:hypothetical protein
MKLLRGWPDVGRRMLEFYPPGFVVRVFYRPMPHWRPFFSRRYMFANFGGPFFGVMVMRARG